MFQQLDDIITMAGFDISCSLVTGWSNEVQSSGMVEPSGSACNMSPGGLATVCAAPQWGAGLIMHLPKVPVVTKQHCPPCKQQPGEVALLTATPRNQLSPPLRLSCPTIVHQSYDFDNQPTLLWDSQHGVHGMCASVCNFTGCRCLLHCWCCVHTAAFQQHSHRQQSSHVTHTQYSSI